MKTLINFFGALMLHVGMSAQTEYHRVATEQPTAHQDFMHNVEEIIFQDGQVQLMKTSGIVEFYDINTLDKLSFFDCQDHVFHPEYDYGSVTDIDGNTYKTIAINGEVWMAENLRTTRFNNGDSIANILPHPEWISTNGPAWCYYNNDPIYECPYGKLYNSFVSTDTRNVCPVGWHVTTLEEYADMVGSYGGTITSDDSCCAALKSPGNYYWQGAEVGADNASGYSALPGGMRGGNTDGEFANLGQFGWWQFYSITENQLYNFALAGGVNGSGPPNWTAYWNYFSPNAGTSIRCVQD
jgi:uncharacterized protein (TIGR02145 family)